MRVVGHGVEMVVSRLDTVEVMRRGCGEVLEEVRTWRIALGIMIVGVGG